MKTKKGKDIMKLYEKIEKSGITAEDIMFYLLVFMEKKKTNQIEMDIIAPNNVKKTVQVFLNKQDFDDKPKNLPPMVI